MVSRVSIFCLFSQAFAKMVPRKKYSGEIANKPSKGGFILKGGEVSPASGYHFDRVLSI